MTDNYIKRGSLGVKGILIMINIELKALLTNKHIIYQGILSPILYFIFYSFGIKYTFGNIIYNNKEVDYLTFSVIGIFAMCLFKEMYQCVYRMVTDRRWGLLSLKMLNGINSFEYILGISTFPVIGVILQTTVLYIMTCILGGSFSLIAFLKIEGILLIGVLFWTSLLSCITLLLTDYKKRDFVMDVVFVPILFATPLFYSLDNANEVIKFISQINPLTYQLGAMRDVVFNTTDMLNFNVSVVLTLICFIISNLILRNVNYETNEH